MKKVFLLIVFLCSTHIFSVENVIIKISGDQDIIVEKSVIEKLQTFKDAIEESVEFTEDIEIPIENQSTDNLNRLIKYLEIDQKKWEKIAKEDGLKNTVSTLTLAEIYGAPENLKNFLIDQVVNINTVLDLEFLYQNLQYLDEDIQTAMTKQLNGRMKQYELPDLDLFQTILFHYLSKNKDKKVILPQSMQTSFEQLKAVVKKINLM